MNKRRLEFVVSIEQPEDATIGDLKDYIEDAASTWCGQYRPPGADGADDPGHPLWGIGKTVKVKRLHQKRKESAEKSGVFGEQRQVVDRG
jgi:hypothetical protein